MPGLYVQINTDNIYSNEFGLVTDGDVYSPNSFAI
jgi:hypothetical protein